MSELSEDKIKNYCESNFFDVSIFYLAIIFE